jgi:putative aldouronate transport system substrate-binding protein
MTMTDEESQEYASVYANILTLVQENTVKFINGTKSMDEYDSFIDELSKYGIDRCIELKQAALDRYLKRGN